MDCLVAEIYNANIIDTNFVHEVTNIFRKSSAKIELKESTKPIDIFRRIQYAKRVFDWNSVKTLLETYEQQLDKSEQLSIKLREKGNELYNVKNGKGALRAYTLAISFAPNSSEALGIAYCNRSAVLLEIKKPTEALCDINLAQKTIKNATIKQKLKERASKCEQAIKDLGKNPGTHSKSNAQAAENLFEIHQPNETIPTAESFVKIEFSRERGRHLTVTQDIPAGTVLLTDKPYVYVLNNLLNWETEHCHNCSKSIVNGIPCHQCTFAFFCTEECRKSACNKGIHRYEHNYLPILRAFDASHADIQALRIIATVGSSEAFRLFKTRDSLYFNKQLKPDNIGYDKKGIYNVNSYLPIFHLISHQLKQTEDFFMIAMKAVFLTKLLKHYSDFMKSNESEEFEDFVASLVLKHLESIRYNAISQSKLEYTSQISNSQVKSVAYAAAVYPLISLCNHSCDPNCVPVRKSKNLQTALIALKQLKTGEELFITYKPLYNFMKTPERQQFLAENYKFICNCQACEESWGPDFLSHPEMVKTTQGGGGTVIFESTRCDICTGSDKRQCHKCALEDVSKAKEIHKLEGALFECHDLLGQGQYAECQQKLAPILNHFGEKKFFSHFPLYSIAMDLYKRALVYSVSNLQL